MKKSLILGAIFLIILAIAGLSIFKTKHSATGKASIPAVTEATPQNPSQAAQPSPSIIIFSPTTGEHISIPFSISGKARGEWFSNGVFPISLVDASGTVLAQASAAALEGWNTNDYVDFQARLDLTSSTSTSNATSAVMIFSKFNPSGLAQNSLIAQVPVVIDFKK